MIHYNIKIYDPLHFGIYPKDNIYVDGLGYLVVRNIPIFFTSFLPSETKKRSPYDRRNISFIASFMFCKVHFPVYCFSPFDYATIHIKSIEPFSNKAFYDEIKKIINCQRELPILNNPYGENISSNDAQKLIMKIRSKNNYIDMFHQKKKPFNHHIDFLSDKYTFSDHTLYSKTFKRYYTLFLNTDQSIRIALYHFVKAGRLINNDFIEDAGLNLYMVLESIIKDYMMLSSTRNKSRAINDLLLTKLKVPEELFDWFVELYEARNDFLAHVDYSRYHEEGFVTDPDSYCFDHYEPVGKLLLKYIDYKNDFKKRL